jgi:hypothetical protein
MVDQRNLSSTLVPDLYEIRIESPSDLHCHRVLISRVKLKKKKKKEKKIRKQNRIWRETKSEKIRTSESTTQNTSKFPGILSPKSSSKS